MPLKNILRGLVFVLCVVPGLATWTDAAMRDCQFDYDLDGDVDGLDLQRLAFEFHGSDVDLIADFFGHSNCELPSAVPFILATIDSDKIDEELVDFPVMLKLDDDRASDFFDRIVSDPANELKFRIEDSHGRQCYVEKELWDYTNRLLVLHVKVPLIRAAADTVLKLSYDEAMADNDDYVGDTGSAAAQNVWDDAYHLVLHMAEKAYPGSYEAYNSKDGTKIGQGSGLGDENFVDAVGQGYEFYGDPEYLQLDCAVSVKGQANVTVEALVAASAYPSSGSNAIYFEPTANGGYTRLGLWYTDTGALRFGGRDTNTGSDYGVAGDAGDLPLGVLSHCVGIWDSANDIIKTLLNGEPARQLSQAIGGFTVNDPNDTIGVGSFQYSYYSTYSQAVFDEVRISRAVRSNAWIKATYHSLLDTWVYDGWDRCIDHYSVNGTGVAIDYVTDSRVDVTDAYGTVRTYTLDAIGGRKRVAGMQGVVGAPYDNSNIVRWQYDTDLNLIEVETAGGTIHQYQNYDHRGNPRTIILASGAPEQRTIVYTYHPAMNVVLTRTEPSVLGTGDKVTIRDFDDDDNAIPNENPTNLLSRLIDRGYTKDATGTTLSYEYITTFTYNAAGQTISIDGPRTDVIDVTFFNYHPSGDLDYITRPLIGTAYFKNYDDAGQLGRFIDVNDQSEAFSYDGRGRITAVTHEADASVSRISFNPAGLPDTTEDEDDVTRTHEYDENARLYRAYDEEGNYRQYLYDDQGNLIEKSAYDPDGYRPTRRRWDYQHPDIPGKLFKEIQTDDIYAEYDYDSDGRIRTLTDFNKNTTVYDYDRLDRLITVTQPDSVVTRYGYDGHGNLRSVMDAENHETTYIYDDMGRVLSTISADTGYTGYVYDAAGSLVQKTDAMEISVHYVYDALNRLKNVSYPDSAQNITYSYDAGSYGMGRLTGMTDPAGVAEFRYDSRGRFVAKDRIIAGQTHSTSRGFTPGGRLNLFTYPSGRTIDYTRHSSGRIEQATTTYNLSTLTLVEKLSYNPLGPARGLDTGSGGKVINTIDENGGLKVINSGRSTQRQYKYDGNRNLLSSLASNNAYYNRQYSYDPLNRLETAKTVFGNSNYTYDDVGNRLSLTINGQADSYTYQPGTNRLAQISGANPAVFSYNDNGNITDIDGTKFDYNQNNRLIRVRDGSSILAEYTYNGIGQRLIKAVDGIARIYHYDFDGNIIAESLPPGTMNVEYLYVDQSRMAMVNTETGKLYFYHNNYLGTPVLMTDDTGTVVWEADYMPFGEASVNPKSTVENNFRFAGQYYDEESGLHYNWHRYYDPKTGRYLTPDPIGLIGGINLYSYASNNPINLTDPLGLLTESFHEATGGGWNSPPPRYSPSHNIFRNVSIDLSKYVSASCSQTFMGKGTTL